jgi:hemin uptake protein HemP
MNMKSQVTRPQGNNAPPPGGTRPHDLTPPSVQPAHQSPRMLDSHALLGDQAMVHIQHLGEIYRLQSTRHGKLILTK